MTTTRSEAIKRITYVVSKLICVVLVLAGVPLIMTHLSDHEVVAHRGQDVLLRVIVCADPRPRRAAWEWGSMLLEAGAGVGRTRADELLGVRTIYAGTRILRQR